MEVREPSAKYLSRPSRVLTSAGELPADWIVQPLGELMRLLNGRAFRPDEWSDTGAPIIRIQNLNDPDSDFNFFSGVVDERNVVRPGDLLFAWSGTTGSSFGARVWTGPEGVLNQHIFKVLPDPRKLSSAFAYRLLLKAQYSIERQAHGFKASFVHVKKSDLVSVSAGYPPTLKEQDRIAETLANADALIDSLEQLLTKKRQIKQGAMQELLTGKRRLRQAAEWHDLRLGDVASLKARIGWQGLTTAEYRERGDHLLVTGTEFFGGRIRWDACHYVDQDRYDQDKNIQLVAGDVLVTKDGTIGKAALIDTLPMPATLNSGVFVIRPRNQAFHPGFFYYLLASTVFSSFLGQLSAGSTINHLYQKDFVHFKFRAPQDLEEQRAVFEVLKAIDSEIETLDSRLTKARALKQAMAQSLLTGRIRLVEPTA